MPPWLVVSLVESVVRWYDQAARPLPWRAADCSPWGVLVSEVMLQQTQVDRVIPAWQAWMARWPSPRALAAADLADVLQQWGRLGYPRRARWLWQAAHLITETHGGDVPRDEAALRELPGIGTYTAAAVCAFAFGQATVVLDTNVRRVLTRAVHGRAWPPAHINNAERQEAAALLPVVNPARWSVAVMELGALVCTAQRPDCERCPIAPECAWRAAGYPAADVRPRRQATFQGSDREARGIVLAVLRAGPATEAIILAAIPGEERGRRALDSLMRDGLIHQDGETFRLGTTSRESAAADPAS